MSHHENIKILAFVGLAGSGKSTAIKYIAEHKHPKVIGDSIEEIINEVSALINAGQHIIAVDGPRTVEELRQLKHTFPRLVQLVCVVAAPDTRKNRLAKDSATVFQDKETGNISELATLADETIQNDGTLLEFYEQIDRLVDTHH